MLRFLNSFFKSCWTNLREYLGIEDGNKNQWNSVFERKILEGNVGFSLKWPSMFENHIIMLETEALVRELSNTDSPPVVCDEMERRVKPSGRSRAFPLRLHPPQRQTRMPSEMTVSNCDVDSATEPVDVCSHHLACSLPPVTENIIRRYQRTVELESYDIDLKRLCNNRAKLFKDDMHLMFKSENRTPFCEHSKIYEADASLRGTTAIENSLFHPSSFDVNYFEIFKKSCYGRSSSYKNPLILNLQAGRTLRPTQPKMEVRDKNTFSLLDALNLPPDVNISDNYSLEDKSLDKSTDELAHVNGRRYQPAESHLTKGDSYIGSDVDGQFQQTEMKNKTQKDTRSKPCAKINPSVNEPEADKRHFLLSTPLTLMQKAFSFIFCKLTLCKKYAAMVWHDKSATASTPGLKDDLFVTKTSAKNPLHYATAKPSKTDCGISAVEQIDFLQGKDAYNYYKLLITVEKEMNLRQMELDWKHLTELYRTKKKLLSQFVAIAKEYYRDPTEDKRRKWMELKKNIERTTPSFTDVRHHVSTARNRIPLFSMTLILVRILIEFHNHLSQVIVLIVLCVRFGVEQFGFEGYKRTQVNIPTFLGSETVTVLDKPNPFLGPPEHAFWKGGAAVARCFGAEPGQAHGSAEATSPVTGTPSRHGTKLGCCEMGSHFNTAGTTTLRQCKKATTGLGTWRAGTICSRRIAPNNYVAHVIKPCCEAATGSCRMLSHEHCAFIRGIFHIWMDHCQQVNCLKSPCRLTNDASTFLPKGGTGSGLSWRTWLPWVSHAKPGPGSAKDASSNTDTDTDTDAVTGKPRQWWRLISALPLTFGVLHLLLVVAVEASLMLPVEMCVGWHRVLIIFVCSALAGEMMACSREPSRPHDGSTGGAAGFLGVAYLELFQAWPFLPRPLCEAAKLAGVTLIFLALGILHFVSLAAVLTGPVIGATLCLMVVPYITFGRRLGYSRLRVVLVGFILFTTAMIFIHIYFISTLFPRSLFGASMD